MYKNPYVLIGADIVPTNSNSKLFINGDVKALIGENLKKVLDAASYRIFNLEIPLVDQRTPIIKEGPNLIATVNTIEGFRALGVNLLTLANNHILDQGIQGLESTMKTLNQNKISYLGVGENLDDASKPFVFSFNRKKIGVYACVEHEFSIAGENKPGANPFDPLWSFDHAAELKSKCDFVIILYHGGKEHYRYPSPMLQKVCRRFVDKGADLVICQHSHCVGCEEKYKNSTIIYGQGNFIFDDCDDECWQTSLLVKLNDDFTVSYLPIVKTENGVRLADIKKNNEIMEGFFTRSKEITIPGEIKKIYSKFADSFLEFYLKAFLGRRSFIFRILNKLSKGEYMRRYLQNTYSAYDKVKIANYIDCEAHRELFSQALSNSYKPLDSV